MSVPNTSSNGHTPLTGDEATMLDTDLELSALMEESVENRDLDTLLQAIAEKRSIERAFQASRWDTFNHRMHNEFGGDA